MRILKVMGQSGTHKVLEIRQLTALTYVIRLERKGMQFVPGQHFNIGLVDGAINREYSSYSGENETYLEFLIREVEGGLVSPQLKRLNVGDEVSLDGAYGLFVLDEKKISKNKFLFIGSGTGIAPFHSFVVTYHKLDYQILHGIRESDEKYDYQDYDAKRYVACVSQKPSKGDYSGRVTNYLRDNPIKDNGNLICYICGNSEMINDVYDILQDQGVNSSDIITEVFF